MDTRFLEIGTKIGNDFYHVEYIADQDDSYFQSLPIAQKMIDSIKIGNTATSTLSPQPLQQPQPLQPLQQPQPLQPLQQPQPLQPLQQPQPQQQLQPTNAITSTPPVSNNTNQTLNNLNHQQQLIESNCY